MIKPFIVAELEPITRPPSVAAIGVHQAGPLNGQQGKNKVDMWCVIIFIKRINNIVKLNFYVTIYIKDSVKTIFVLFTMYVVQSIEVKSN